MGLRISQLNGLDPSQVVVVPRPLAVAGLLGEGGLQDQLVRLVVQVVVEVVPQQTVDQHGLALEVIPQSGSPEPCVQSRP